MELVFVPSPFDKHDASAMLDATSAIPLFPLSDWDLVRGPKTIAGDGLQDGVSLWTFVRTYKSDIFTSDGSGGRVGASFSNVILTFAVGRQPQFFLMQVIPVIVIMSFMSVITLRMPLQIQDGEYMPSSDSLSIRLATVTTLLLAAVAYKLALAGMLPNTRVPTYLDALFSAFYLANCLAAGSSVAAAHWSPAHAPLIDDIGTAAYIAVISAALLHFMVGYARRPSVIVHHAEGQHASSTRVSRREKLRV